MNQMKYEYILQVRDANGAWYEHSRFLARNNEHSRFVALDRDIPEHWQILHDDTVIHEKQTHFKSEPY